MWENGKPALVVVAAQDAQKGTECLLDWGAAKIARYKQRSVNAVAVASHEQHRYFVQLLELMQCHSVHVHVEPDLPVFDKNLLLASCLMDHVSRDPQVWGEPLFLPNAVNRMSNPVGCQSVMDEDAFVGVMLDPHQRSEVARTLATLPAKHSLPSVHQLFGKWEEVAEELQDASHGKDLKLWNTLTVTNPLHPVKWLRPPWDQHPALFAAGDLEPGQPICVFSGYLTLSEPGTWSPRWAFVRSVSCWFFLCFVPHVSISAACFLWAISWRARPWPWMCKAAQARGCVTGLAGPCRMTLCCL